MNKKAIVRTALCAVLVSALGYSFVAKSETKLIPFQGKLTDASGQVISDGAIVVQFKMYDAPVGGQAKWNGEVQMLSVNGGLVNTTLGTKASLKNVDFSSPTYLEITIDANGDNQIGPEDPPLLPRQSIIPAVYAVQAGDAKTLSGYDWSAVFSNGDPETGTINGAKLADQSVDTKQIANNAVTTTQIKAGSVTTDKIASGAVKSNQLADGAVNVAQVADGAITTAKLAENAVTTENIATNSITADKLDLSDAELNKLVGAIKKYLSKPVEGFDWTVSFGAGSSLEMIWCNPGTFTMGSPIDELGRRSREPQYEVTLTKGFWLGKYEVTQAQYEAVMKNNPSSHKGANLPVENVNWNNAVNFCAKLTDREHSAGRLPQGYKYTLPTEAQWEYACRAETTTALNNGKNLSNTTSCPEMDEVGWYAGNASSTYPVGWKKPNTWGFYDMHGNVWEWCLDWYGDYPTSSVTDPKGAGTGSYRVYRGGSWRYSADYCRSAHRDFDYAGESNNSNGFRVALVPVQ